MSTKNRPQFSKLIVLVVTILFLTSLVTTYLLPGIDDTVRLTEITVTGGIFSSTVIWYMKKSQQENVVKLKIGLLKNIAEVEYEYYEKRLRLKDELHVPLDEDEDDPTILDDVRQAEIEGDVNYVDEKFAEAIEEETTG